MSVKLKAILKETGRSLDEIKAVVLEALENGSYFDPDLLDELKIEFTPEEVK